MSSSSQTSGTPTHKGIPYDVTKLIQGGQDEAMKQFKIAQLIVNQSTNATQAIKFRAQPFTATPTSSRGGSAIEGDAHKFAGGSAMHGHAHMRKGDSAIHSHVPDITPHPLGGAVKSTVGSASGNAPNTTPYPDGTAEELGSAMISDAHKEGSAQDGDAHKGGSAHDGDAHKEGSAHDGDDIETKVAHDTDQEAQLAALREQVRALEEQAALQEQIRVLQAQTQALQVPTAPPSGGPPATQDRAKLQSIIVSGRQILFNGHDQEGYLGVPVPTGAIAGEFKIPAQILCDQDMGEPMLNAFALQIFEYMQSAIDKTSGLYHDIESTMYPPSEHKLFDFKIFDYRKMPQVLRLIMDTIEQAADSVGAAFEEKYGKWQCVRVGDIEAKTQELTVLLRLGAQVHHGWIGLICSPPGMGGNIGWNKQACHKFVQSISVGIGEIDNFIFDTFNSFGDLDGNGKMRWDIFGFIDQVRARARVLLAFRARQPKSPESPPSAMSIGDRPKTGTPAADPSASKNTGKDCFQCGAVGHVKSECTEPKQNAAGKQAYDRFYANKKKCQWCGRMGHTEPECRKKKSGEPRSARPARSSETNESKSSSATSSSSSNANTVTVNIDLDGDPDEAFAKIARQLGWEVPTSASTVCAIGPLDACSDTGSIVSEAESDVSSASEATSTTSRTESSGSDTDATDLDNEDDASADTDEHPGLSTNPRDLSTFPEDSRDMVRRAFWLQDVQLWERPGCSLPTAPGSTWKYDDWAITYEDGQPIPRPKEWLRRQAHLECIAEINKLRQDPFRKLSSTQLRRGESDDRGDDHGFDPERAFMCVDRDRRVYFRPPPESDFRKMNGRKPLKLEGGLYEPPRDLDHFMNVMCDNLFKYFDELNGFEEAPSAMVISDAKLADAWASLPQDEQERYDKLKTLSAETVRQLMIFVAKQEDSHSDPEDGARAALLRRYQDLRKDTTKGQSQEIIVDEELDALTAPRLTSDKIRLMSQIPMSKCQAFQIVSGITSAMADSGADTFFSGKKAMFSHPRRYADFVPAGTANAGAGKLDNCQGQVLLTHFHDGPGGNIVYSIPLRWRYEPKMGDQVLLPPQHLAKEMGGRSRAIFSVERDFMQVDDTADTEIDMIKLGNSSYFFVTFAEVPDDEPKCLTLTVSDDVESKWSVRRHETVKVTLKEAHAALAHPSHECTIKTVETGTGWKLVGPKKRWFCITCIEAHGHKQPTNSQGPFLNEIEKMFGEGTTMGLSSRQVAQFKADMLNKLSAIKPEGTPAVYGDVKTRKKVRFAADEDLQMATVYTDLVPIKLSGRNYHLAVFIDQATSYTWVFIHKSKDEVVLSLRKMETFARTHRFAIRRVVTDPAGEYTGQEWRSACGELGIMPVALPARSQHGNLAERHVQELMAAWRAVILHARLPINKFALLVLPEVVKRLNCRGKLKFQWKSPYRMMFGTNPNLSQLYVIGAFALVVKPLSHSKGGDGFHKLNPVAVQGIYIGSDHKHGSQASMIYRLDTGRIERSQHVIVEKLTVPRSQVVQGLRHFQAQDPYSDDPATKAEFFNAQRRIFAGQLEDQSHSLGPPIRPELHKREPDASEEQTVPQGESKANRDVGDIQDIGGRAADAPEDGDGDVPAIDEEGDDLVASEKVGPQETLPDLEINQDADTDAEDDDPAALQEEDVAPAPVHEADDIQAPRRSSRQRKAKSPFTGTPQFTGEAGNHLGSRKGRAFAVMNDPDVLFIVEEDVTDGSADLSPEDADDCGMILDVLGDNIIGVVSRDVIPPRASISTPDDGESIEDDGKIDESGSSHAYAAKGHPDIGLSYGQAIANNPDEDERQGFLTALKKEFHDGLIGKGYMRYVTVDEVPHGTKIIPMLLTFVRKRHASGPKKGQVSKLKCRCVLRGDIQRKLLGIKKGAYSSPAANLSVMRAVVAMGKQPGFSTRKTDCTMAFLYATAGRQTYSMTPRGCHKYDVLGRRMFLQVLANLYGGTDAGLRWIRLAFQALQRMGFKASLFDPCLWRKALPAPTFKQEIQEWYADQTVDDKFKGVDVSEQVQEQQFCYAAVQATVRQHDPCEVFPDEDDGDAGRDVQARVDVHNHFYFDQADIVPSVTKFEHDTLIASMPLNDVDDIIWVTLVIYVDDIIIVGNDLQAVKYVSDRILHLYPGTTEADPTEFLGMEILRKDDGDVMYLQDSLIKKLLDNAGMTGCKTKSSTRVPMHRPVEIPKEELDSHQRVHVQQLLDMPRTIGELGYLKNSQPWVAYAHSQFSRVLTRATKEHVADIKKLCRYLAGRVGQGVRFRNDQDQGLYVFVDANHGSDPGSENWTGIAVFLCGGCIYAQCLRQKFGSKSTFEAELGAMSQAQTVGTYYRAIARDMGLNVEKAIILGDNLEAVKECNSAFISSAVKQRHHRVRLNLVKQDVTRGLIEYHHIRTDDNVADILTKPIVDYDKWTDLYGQLMGEKVARGIETYLKRECMCCTPTDAVGDDRKTQ